MEKVIEVLKELVVVGPAIVSAVVAVLSALIGLFMLIPGEQPEKALRGAVEFLAKFSSKPKLPPQE